MTNPRPWRVTVVAWLYLAVGAIGFLANGWAFLKHDPLGIDVVEVELTEALAVIAGVFLLRGANWARWLALAWILFHVALSAFPVGAPFAAHCVFAAVIGWVLFRSESSEYFRGVRTA